MVSIFGFDVFLLILVLPFWSLLNGVSLYKQKNYNFSFAVWILNWHGMSLIIISCAVSGFPLLPTIRKSVGKTLEEVLESYSSARLKEKSCARGCFAGAPMAMAWRPLQHGEWAKVAKWARAMQKLYNFFHVNLLHLVCVQVALLP